VATGIRVPSNYPAASSIYERLKALVVIADDMRATGIKVDRERVAWLRAGAVPGCAKMREELCACAHSLGVKDFNPNSSSHVAKIFFGAFKLNPIEQTATGKPKIDKGVLIDFLRIEGSAKVTPIRDFASLLLKYRQLTKLVSTYLTDIQLDDQDLTYINWLPQRTKTGRWSSKPNAQNIPAALRCIYVPRREDNYFVGELCKALHINFGIISVFTVDVSELGRAVRCGGMRFRLWVLGLQRRACGFSARHSVYVGGSE
jgi:DNA polymerase I-like protein with 3'-5' exonuclease and polymerase domains